MRKAKRISVMLEFLIFGIVIGIAEDAIAVMFVTGEPITWEIIGLIVLIAVPFAILGEIIVDNIDFAKWIDKHILKNKSKK